MSTYLNANYGINRIGGEGVGSRKGQGIYEESSYAKFDLGEKLELKDGREFRYANFGAAVGAGLVVSQDVSATCAAESQGTMTAAAAGATEVVVTDATTLGSATADQFAGGYLHIVDDAGEAHQYRIKSNTAASSNAVTFTLYDGLVVAVTTATDVAITGGLYNKLVGATGATDYIVSGVTPIAFTSGYYGWVQTRGIATVLSDGAITVGQTLMLSDNVAGSVEALDATAVANSHPIVGYATFAPDDTGYVGVALQLP
jgi:hypothetical protein